jgi:hypothetical protein
MSVATSHMLHGSDDSSHCIAVHGHILPAAWLHAVSIAVGHTTVIE